MSDAKQNYDLDLRGTICPMAFVKLRLFADQQPDGATISVLYEDTPANEPLARSTAGIGHKIVCEEHTAGASENSAASLKIMTIQVRR